MADEPMLLQTNIWVALENDMLKSVVLEALLDEEIVLAGGRPVISRSTFVPDQKLGKHDVIVLGSNNPVTVYCCHTLKAWRPAIKIILLCSSREQYDALPVDPEVIDCAFIHEQDPPSNPPFRPREIFFSDPQTDLPLKLREVVCEFLRECSREHTHSAEEGSPAIRVCPHRHLDPLKNCTELISKQKLTYCLDLDKDRHPVARCACGCFNRTTARRCEKCDADFAASEIEQRFLEQLRCVENPARNTAYDLHLRSEGATAIAEMQTALGYLFVRTHGAGVLVYCGYKPWRGNLFPQKPDETLTGMRLVTPSLLHELPYMLINAEREVYKLALSSKMELCKASLQKSLTLDETLVFQPFATSGGFAVFVRNKKSKLLTLRCGQQSLQISEDICAPIQTEDGKIVFYSKERIFVFDCANTGFDKYTAPTELNITDRPVYHRGLRQIFVRTRNERLLRFDLHGAQRFVTLHEMPCSSDFRFTVNDDPQSKPQVYIAHKCGITALHAYDGAPLWSTETLRLRADCSSFAPGLHGRFLFFTAKTNSGSRVGLLDLLHRNQPALWTETHEKITVAPVMCGDKLFVATEDAKDYPKIAVYHIK